MGVLRWLATLTTGGTASASLARVAFIVLHTDGTNAAVLTLKDKSGGTTICVMVCVGADLSKEFYPSRPLGEKGDGPYYYTVSGTGAAAYFFTDD
jgi:hypothetical protein